MSTTIRIDEETYRLATISKHQQNALSQIFTKLAELKRDFSFIFEYNMDMLTITTYAIIPSKKLEIDLPFLKRKNRLFRDENVLIPEKFLFSGENMIYILRDLLTPYTESIKFKQLVANIKLFEYETETIG